ncbi:anti-sigma factor family protein [Paeniglutamicibacter sp. NPDC012692]|uniref:anti-sigma factor family protein n=1 Tax=Paeniglutamicibacter sp. NPDC012692 TaxID=3364388 RepID=UPI00368DEB6B
MNASNEPLNEHILLGAYILGGLSPSERLEFELHLEGCAACQDEMQGASGLSALLGTLKLSDTNVLLGMEPPMDAMEPDLDADAEPEPQEGCIDLLERLATKRRNKRLRIGAFGLAAVAASVATGVFLAPVIRPSPGPDASFAVASELGPRVELGMNAKAWGTELEFSGADLPTSGILSLWVVDHGGVADRAGSWQATTTGKTKLIGAVPTQLGNIATVQLRDYDSKVLAVVTLPQAPAPQS